MPIDRPTGSVSGQQDWEWNQWQTERESRTQSAESPENRSHGAPASDRRRCPREREDLRREIRELEDELERTERRCQQLIDQYERLLDERNRRLAGRTSAEADSDGLSAVLLNALRRIAGR